MEGTVKWFNPSKGYGFIQGSDGTDYSYESILEGNIGAAVSLVCLTQNDEHCHGKDYFNGC